MSERKNDLYEQDFYAWARTQAALLRAGRLAEADIDNIAEEIDSMGRSEKRELINRLVVLISHLLKWQFQPIFRGRSWELTIKEQRLRLTEHLADNPSLKSTLSDALATAYKIGRVAAQRQTGLSKLPAELPYTFDQIADEAFFPES